MTDAVTSATTDAATGATTDATTGAATTAGIRSQICPQCGRTLSGDSRYTLWCQDCEWNLDPTPPEPERGLRKLVSVRADKLAARLFEQVRAHPETERRGFGLTLLAWLLACGVHLVTVALAVLAVEIALAGGFPVVVRALGVILAGGFALIVQPYRPRRRKAERLEVTRDTAPSLYGLIDEVATAVGAPPVTVVHIDSLFNASYSTPSRGEKVLTLGLRLWSVLDPQERVALLGHELGHAVNGDLRRLVIVRRAIYSLWMWQVLLTPARSLTRRRGQRARNDGLIRLAEYLTPLVMLPFAFAISLLRAGLDLISSRNGQRCEYYADELAARTGGSAAAVSFTEKMLAGDISTRAMNRAVKFIAGSNPWLAAREQVSITPDAEWERLRRVARRRLSRIDVSHPPTQLRADLLRARPVREPTVVLDEAVADAIDSELAPAAATVTAALRAMLGAPPPPAQPVRPAGRPGRV
jgi:Zn-dependent protease with chaperone function